MYTPQKSFIYYQCMVGKPQCLVGWYIPINPRRGFKDKTPFLSSKCPRCGNDLGRTAKEKMATARKKRLIEKKQLPSRLTTGQLKKQWGRS